MVIEKERKRNGPKDRELVRGRETARENGEGIQSECEEETSPLIMCDNQPASGPFLRNYQHTLGATYNSTDNAPMETSTACVTAYS